MIRLALVIALSPILALPAAAQDVNSLAGKRVVFLGDSISQAGGYIGFTTYYLERLNPKKDFDILGLGLASETLSGLSEEGHAGGKFPRPCLFERLGRLFEKAKPEVVFACYGMNDGIYLPLDKERTAAFQRGITKLIEKCKDAGVKQIFLVTPPIYDFEPKRGEFNYDAVLTEYAKWETSLTVRDVTVIDLHSAMRKARANRTEPYSKDRVHPGDDGQLVIAKTILSALGVKPADDTLTSIKADSHFKLVEEKRNLRSAAWMKHIGYTREKTVDPGPLGSVEEETAKIQERIDALRRTSNANPAKPVKVFILAGQSKMEGQGVGDLEGKDYNDGQGTLKALFADPAKATHVMHLRTEQGKWTVRDDVWVRYKREKQPLLAGPLSVGFAVYGGTHHFGPELQFGHVVGDHFQQQVLLIKAAWGGKSLSKDFRPPISGGEVGPYYTKMIAEIREALANLKTDFPSYAGQGYELAGFVWYHGWNDGVDPKKAIPEYEQNLVNLIHDVRKEFTSPRLPVVIGELTGPWVEASGEWTTLRKAQAAAADRPEFKGNVLFVPTREFVRPAKQSPNPTHGHHEFGNAETYFLVGHALGKRMIKLMTSPR